MARRTPPAPPGSGSAAQGIRQDARPGARGVLDAPPLCTPEHRQTFLIAAILASTLGLVDATMVAVALPAMRATLGAGLAEAQWFHNAYMLTLCALMLAGGAAGDRFGLVRVFSLGIAVFAAASLVCALAGTASHMIVARAVQGLGAAIMVPGSLALIARVYPPGERARAIGIWAAASALTTALGPVLGGLTLSLGGPEIWRALFAINVPGGALLVWLLYRRLAADPVMQGSRVDWAGTSLVTAALLAIAWGLTGGGHDGAPQMDLRWLGVGFGLLVAFLWVEQRVAAPMLPLAVFANRVFSAANLMTFTFYAALSLIVFYLPITLIAGWQVSAFSGSISIAPLPVVIAALAPLAGPFADRVGAPRTMAAGNVLIAGGYAALALLIGFERLWHHVVPIMCVVGVGMALVVVPLSTAVMSALDEAQAGLASGVNNAVSRLAGLMAIAAAGAPVAAIYADAGGTASFGIDSTSAGHAVAMNAAFSALAWTAAGLSLVSACLALSMRPGRPAALSR